MIGTKRTILRPEWSFTDPVRAKNFANHIFLLRDDNPIPDTCLCPNDAAAHQYFFVDQNGFMHFSENGFGYEDVKHRLDSIKKDNVWSYWFDLVQFRKILMGQASVPYLEQHDMMAVLKFEKNADALVQYKRKKDGKFIQFTFYDFNSKQGTNVAGPFFCEHKPADSLKTKLLDEDSIIKFNDRVFHCWWFQQELNWQGYIYTVRFCIDKESLVMVGYESEMKFVGAGFVHPSHSKNRYHLSAIMEFSEETLNRLKMWKVD